MPSATQNELDGDDARALLQAGCFAVSEGANMPSTPEAVDEFQKARILYAPGKAANAGGVSVSGLEMAQNSQKVRWTAEDVDCRLRDIMADIHSQCVEYGNYIGPIYIIFIVLWRKYMYESWPVGKKTLPLCPVCMAGHLLLRINY